MRLFATTLLLISGLLALGACGGGGAKGTVYGSPAEQGTAIPIAEVFAKAKELDGKQVRVEGTVTGVCAKRGCWIEIADDSQPEGLTFKVQDGVMVFPLDAKGKHAVADGIVRRIELTLEETREEMANEAAEEGKAFDPATVTGPRVYVRLDGIGARITNPA